MGERGSAAIEARLRACAGERAAFIPFVTAGDPDFDASCDIILRLAAFSDVIEIGIPYSDPLADGPAIQAGSLRALAAGMTMPRALELIRRARAQTDVPLIAFTYINPVLQFGFARFAAACRGAGADGIIVPDLPHEESFELRAAAEEQGLALIPLLALTSRERVRRIAAAARGFVYCVSSLGVTGERSGFAPELRAFVEAAKAASRAPVAVGFGVSRPEHVRELSAYADGVIVGSALVRLCGRVGEALAAGDRAEAARRGEALAAFAKSLADAGVREERAT